MCLIHYIFVYTDRENAMKMPIGRSVFPTIWFYVSGSRDILYIELFRIIFKYFPVGTTPALDDSNPEPVNRISPAAFNHTSFEASITTLEELLAVIPTLPIVVESSNPFVALR